MDFVLRVQRVFFSTFALVLLLFSSGVHAIELEVFVNGPIGKTSWIESVEVEVYHRSADPLKLRRGAFIGRGLTDTSGNIRFASPQFQIGQQVVIQLSKRPEFPNQYRYQIPESDENWPRHFQAASQIYTTIQGNRNYVRVEAFEHDIYERIQYAKHASLSGRVLETDGERFPKDWYGAHSNSSVDIVLEQLNRDGSSSGRRKVITTQDRFDFGEAPGGWIYKVTLEGSRVAGMRGHVPREMVWHPTQVVEALSGEVLTRNSVHDATFLMMGTADYNNGYRLAATQLYFSGTKNLGVSFLGARIVSGSAGVDSIFVADRYATVNGLGYAMAAIHTYGTLDIGFYAGGRCSFSPDSFWVEDPDLEHVMPECGSNVTAACAHTIAVSNCTVNTDDFDADGVLDDDDNCSFTPNPDQADTDGDGIGDLCDDDTADDADDDDPDDEEDDGDTEDDDQNEEDGDSENDDSDDTEDDDADVNDNQDDDADDESQSDDNRDEDDDDSGVDTADNSLDRDYDGIPDDRDNCPATPNIDQADSDSDGVGDACDSDTGGNTCSIADGCIGGPGTNPDPVPTPVGPPDTVDGEGKQEPTPVPTASSGGGENPKTVPTPTESDFPTPTPVPTASGTPTFVPTPVGPPGTVDGNKDPAPEPTASSSGGDHPKPDPTPKPTSSQPEGTPTHSATPTPVPSESDYPLQLLYQRLQVHQRWFQHQ